MSFRLKIVVWYGVVVLATLLAFRIATVGVIGARLREDFDASLDGEAAWVGKLIRDHRARNVPDAEIVGEIVERTRIAPRKEYIEVYDPDGAEYYRSANLAGATLRGLSSRPGEPVTVTFRGAPLRLLTRITDDFEVHVGYPTADLDAAVDELLASFLYLIPLALLLAVGGGIALLHRFVQPIRTMDRYAEEALALPLDRTLPPPPVERRDEIGRLLERIHAIVERMRESLRRAVGFSTLASHELRSPLAVLRAQIEDALRPDAGADELRTALASTYDEVLRLGSVVEGLLDLSTLQARTVPLDREPVDLGPFLAAFTEDARLLCESRDVRLVVDRRVDALVEADRSRLRQVLFNLVDNALKHVDDGGRIGIGLHLDEDHAVIAVQDDGEGIPPAALARVFDPFYRARGEAAVGAGTGLGLALVRWIVEAHDGTVDVQSRPGQGTRFTLRLPLADPPTGRP